MSSRALSHPDDVPAYDAVIATRNRVEALALSIPRLLGQSCPPARLIVVDASDDHAPIAGAVARLTEGWDGEVIVETAPPGLPRQRNVGLLHVTAPVVFFIDDDSLLCPGAAEAILAVYARDTVGDIAAVCSAEEMTPPPEVVAAGGYAMTRDHKTEARMRRWRNRLEKRLSALKPAIRLGRVLNGRHGVPDWLAEYDAVPVEYMTGFRMSFRSTAIRQNGFDEALGGYAVDEDIDASFSAMLSGLVVGTKRARIYHHRFPGSRSAAFERGRMEVLNRAYVLLKHATGPLGSAAVANTVWRYHLMFTALKLASLLPRATGKPGRARLAGAWAGHRMAKELWHVPTRDRAHVFLRPTLPI